MPDPLFELIRRADTGERLAACVLAKTTGSTPQKAGALMLVLRSGETIGTIGGGCVEAEVRSKALRMLSANRGQSRDNDVLLRFPLDRDYGWDDGLVCGGVMFVAVQLIDSVTKAQPWRQASQALASGQAGRVVLTLTDDQSQPTDMEFVRQPTPKLIIAGAGHIGEALAKIAQPMGFAVTVVDDRADAASADRFPEATRVIGPIDRELSQMTFNELSYVVIVTRGHRHDGDALAAVVGSDAKYVGLIGSRRKTLSIFKRLLDEGVSDELLRRVRAPIGLRIGAISPAEIAISIAAELTACRRGVIQDVSSVMQLEVRHLNRLINRGHRDDKQ